MATSTKKSANPLVKQLAEKKSAKVSAKETATAKATSAGGNVIVQHHGSVTVLKLNYPERRNALSLPLREALETALTEAMISESCRAIVLTGEGNHFCSGGDISSFTGVTPATGHARMQRIHRIVRLMVRGEKPIVAAVEGHAAGAGLCIAANCDVVVASADAKFSCTFNKIGLLPDLGGLWSIPQRMGLGAAKMMMLTGRLLDAEEAHRKGLAEVLAPAGQALEAAIAIAQELAQVSPLSNGLVKAAFARGPMTFEDLLALESDGQGVLYGTEDFQEGRNAFMEKRKPVFRGR